MFAAEANQVMKQNVGGERAKEKERKIDTAYIKQHLIESI